MIVSELEKAVASYCKQLEAQLKLIEINVGRKEYDSIFLACDTIEQRVQTIRTLNQLLKEL